MDNLPPAAQCDSRKTSGVVVWLTGLSAAGKSTIATALARALTESGRNAFILDGDQLRRGLCSDLGFSPTAREENIRRAAEVARLFADAGVICVTAFISPYRAGRELARRLAPPGKFLEVYLATPLEICERRDPKGLYALARAGKIQEFTGVSAPYEPPRQPELILRTDQFSVAECVAKIRARLEEMI